MASDGTDKDGLEPFFAAARVPDVPEVPGDLMARILADAAAAQPAPEGAVADPVPVRAGRRPSLLGAVLATIGGWPGAAGLAVVAGAGVLVGYSPPDLLTVALDGTGFVSFVSDETPASMLVGYDAFLEDG